MGLVPTATLTLYFGGLLTVMGIGALSHGESIGGFFLAWVFSGVFGLLALGSGIRRFGAADFSLKRWEVFGIIFGFLACVPFPFWIRPHEGAELNIALFYLPITASAITGVVLLMSAATKHRNEDKAEQGTRSNPC